MKELPKKPSALIRVAIQDLELCEKDPRYEINMSTWHTPSNGLCFVCLAGATMSKTLEVAPDRYYATQSDAFVANEKQLLALNEFRTGEVNVALRLLKLERPDAIPPYIDILPYQRNPADFKHDMYKLADNLEKAGL